AVVGVVVVVAVAGVVVAVVVPAPVVGTVRPGGLVEPEPVVAVVEVVVAAPVVGIAEVVAPDPVRAGAVVCTVEEPDEAGVDEAGAPSPSVVTTSVSGAAVDPDDSAVSPWPVPSAASRSGPDSADPPPTRPGPSKAVSPSIRRGAGCPAAGSGMVVGGSVVALSLPPAVRRTVSARSADRKPPPLGPLTHTTAMVIRTVTTATTAPTTGLALLRR
ncbi:MAG: hypothetical protein AAF531_19210, partial [Actinomycetota bacterium]